MVDILKPLGYSRAHQLEEADLVILNTCHIREKAEEKLFSDLGRLRLIQAERQMKGRPMMIGVAGCVAQGAGAEILRRAPHVSLVFGPQTYHMLPQMLAQAARQQDPENRGPGRGIVMLDFPAESKFDFFPEENEPRGPVGFLAIQEGCDKFCTYCVVPYTRGAEFSRPVAQILGEARRMIVQGTQELILLGQNVNGYHGSWEGEEGTCSLAQLLNHLAVHLAPLGLRRLRYTTSYPRDVTDDLIKVHGTLPLLMPFLHLPVQSGSDKILKEMNRKHTRDFYCRLIEKFRTAQPDLAFSSDFIVGFPGETDDDFHQTLQLIRELGFAQAYSFKYSPRPGTPAGNRGDQIPEQVKAERLHILQTLLSEQQLAFNQSKVGQTCDILIERPGTKPGQWIGRSPYMQSVHVVDPSLKVGDSVSVTLHAAHERSLKGVLRPHP
jgi:tRNA-2-methylthio-N6-dimethylallyladenosine synthase